MALGEVYAGGDPETSGTAGTVDVSPTVGWVAPGQSFYVKTYGSSSCPNAPVRLAAGEASLRITMTRIGGSTCTADFGPTSYALDLPESLEGALSIAITLDFQDGEQVDLILRCAL
ncbi:hypothetical protein [Arthrobacter agilis]|uniref:hypothetical protein n=1 Tax=Arthrobacter agilis TaxID=37921 RepID=UPI002783486D|nr:hypothetical protein [Arthrobacter agilis]MDQ0734687.1 hypothetical protein [Arthrobacter agilis]